MKKEYTDVEELIKDLVDYKCVIHTPTLEEAKEFVRVMHNKFIMGWSKDYETDYYDNLNETCYDFKEGKDCMNYCSVNYYERDGKEIIEYTDVRDLLINADNNNINNTKEYTDIRDLLLDLVFYKTVINTQSESEAKEFVKIMHDKYNMSWDVDDDYYETYYDTYDESTCYHFEDGVDYMNISSTEWYEDTDMNVVPYSRVRELLLNASL